MPTLVALHAHPDDEAIFTGGTLRRAATANWRVVVVFATSGEQGTTPAWGAEDLAARRRAEAAASCVHLGVDRVEFLDLRDSGASALGSFAPGTLAAACVDEVADEVAELLRGEDVDALTTYDEVGVYGHPDHVAVHQVGLALARADMPVYEATVDTRRVRAVRERLVGRRILAPWLWPADETDRLGTRRHDEVVTADVSAELPDKLAALAEHSSQVLMARTFMGVPAGAFHHLLDHEDFVPSPGPGSPAFESLLAGARFPEPALAT